MTLGWGITEEEERAPLHESETKTVTITLGSGDFRFDYVKIVDVNNAERNVFGAGETVYYSCRFTNRGGSRADATFTITDMDTGQVLKSSVYENMEPLASGTFAKQKLGTMPNKDWHLQFKVVP